MQKSLFIKANGFKIVYNVVNASNNEAMPSYAREVIALRKAIAKHSETMRLVPFDFERNAKAFKDTLANRLQNTRSLLKQFNESKRLQVKIQSLHSKNLIETELYNLQELHESASHRRSFKSEIQRIIKRLRDESKRVETTSKRSKSGMEYETRGGVFVESDSIRKMLRQLKARKVRSDKRPISKDNHVGVEIECMIDASNSLDSFYDAIIKAKLDSKVCVKDDGSIKADDGKRSLELTVCDDETEIFTTIDKVTGILSQFEVAVNKSCGLHVHLDARNREAETMAERLIAAQPLLYSMVPPSRRSNAYCTPTHPEHTIEAPGERYKGINLNAYDAHSTIEVRLHSGTHESRKINNWIKLLLRIIDVEIPSATPTNASEWMQLLQLDQDLGGYVMERISLFAPRKEGEDIAKIPASKEFFANVSFEDESCREDHCGDCESHYDDCTCITCERCDERALEDDARFDDVNSESYCSSCYDEIIDAREIASNSRASRRR